jgi:hypothetical protein
LQSVLEETKMAIHSQIDSVKQRLQDLQTLNISIAEQNKAGHLKLEAHLRQSFRTLYACNVAYLNILLKKEEDQKNGMKASGQKLSFLAVMTSVIQTVGGGLAGGLGAVIAISCKAAERNKSVSDSYQQGIGHDPSYAAPLPNSPVCYKPVTADVDAPLQTAFISSNTPTKEKLIHLPMTPNIEVTEHEILKASSSTVITTSERKTADSQQSSSATRLKNKVQNGSCTTPSITTAFQGHDFSTSTRVKNVEAPKQNASSSLSEVHEVKMTLDVIKNLAVTVGGIR